jgi:cbb3-type cytochrome oxidase subunit 3
MDINLIRIAVTLGALAAFVAIVWWAYLPHRREGLDAEARRILDEGEL